MSRQSAHAAAIGAIGGPIHLLPAGTFTGRDGRGPYLLVDAQAVIEATIEKHGDALAIDRDHAREFLPAGTPIPAAGWIQRLEARADGIWGEVEWTAEAQRQLEGKEYRFISPVFAHDKGGRVLRIERASLTNYPNLVLTALAEQERAHTKEVVMTLESELRTVLGLAEGAGSKEIVAAATAARAAAADLAKLARGLGLAEGATVQAMAEKAQSLAKGAAEPDPAKYVPMAQFKELSDELGNISKTLENDAAERAVTAAQSAGKLAPAMLDWAKAYARKDPEGFLAWCSAAPVIVAPGAGRTGEKPKRGAAMDDEDRAVCSAMGLDPKKFQETLGQEAAE